MAHSRASQAAPKGQAPEQSRLLALAARKFLNLANAERAILVFSDLDNIDRGEFAVAGTSAVGTDVSNDPAHAESWSSSHQIAPFSSTTRILRTYLWALSATFIAGVTGLIHNYRVSSAVYETCENRNPKDTASPRFASSIIFAKWRCSGLSLRDCQ